jgi:hypothetical protein
MHFRQVKRRKFITLIGSATAWPLVLLLRCMSQQLAHGRCAAASVIMERLGGQAVRPQPSLSTAMALNSIRV